jgi:predicted nucleic acid-binding protein
MRVYLDLCCLKRPFDSQTHPRVRLETEAVVALLGAPDGQIRFIRSAAHALENAFNSVASRQEAVSQWLGLASLDLVPINELRLRSITLISLGFSKFDSLHLASAELSQADVFVTVDYPLLNRARRQSSRLTVRITDPIRLAEEVFEWNN